LLLSSRPASLTLDNHISPHRSGFVDNLLEASAKIW